MREVECNQNSDVYVRQMSGKLRFRRRIRAGELDGVNQSVSQIGLTSTAGSHFAG